MFVLIILAVQQLQCPRSSGDTTALAPTQVERRAVPSSANAAPNYPSLLRQAYVGGPVRVSFVLDTTGVPEPVTIKVLRTPNPGFDAAVKRAVASWRFTPALACGRPARVRLAHEFAYLPGSRDTMRLAVLFEVDTSVTASNDTLPDGTPRTTLSWRGTAFVVTPLPWDSARGDSAEEAVLAQLITSVPPTEDRTTRIICLLGPPQRANADQDAGRVSRLTRPGVAVLTFRRCPPTYASMVRTPDQRPDPPGDDPYHLAILARQAIATDRMLFDASVAQGTGGTRYKCGAMRREHGWKVNCLVTAHWVS